jgi:DNA-binding NtrC family response regulator
LPFRGNLRKPRGLAASDPRYRVYGQGKRPVHSMAEDVVKGRLLIVDDEPDMLDFLERVLRQRYEIVRTSNPEEALRWMLEREFDVLVTDQKMPRVSGLELLERISSARPRLVKVLISGYTEVPDIQRAVERGSIHNYVVKPVDGERLLEAIDEAYAVRDGRPLRPLD